MECEVDDMRAFQWVCAHADQIRRINIKAQEAPHVHVENKDGLLGEIHEMLAYDMPHAIQLLRLHLIAPEKVRDAILHTGWSMSLKGDYDFDHDAYGAGASFAWSCITIPTGARNQLEVSVHLWQASGDAECCIQLEVRRHNRDLLERTWQEKARIDADWLRVATRLHEQIAQYEDRPADPDDSDSDDDEDDEDEDGTLEPKEEGTAGDGLLLE